MVKRGWRVTVLVNTTASKLAHDHLHDVRIVHINIARHISPLRDIQTLWTLSRIFRTQKFDIVHSITPKAGLLAMMSARLTGIPVRIHTFTGQVWATRRGPMRWLLRSLDVVLSRCSTALLVDSPSQGDFLVQENVTPRHRLNILGHGSISGVDTTRFSPRSDWRHEIRAAIGTPQDATILLYLGRMHADKGVIELAQAFSLVAAQNPQLHLLLVGPDEGALIQALTFVEACRNRVHVINLTLEPEKYMAAADIFCLASYREGFGLSLVEAASAGLPCVASKIYGVTDAVVDGVTGVLVPVGDPVIFASAAAKLIEQPELRKTMGLTARQRVKDEFSQDLVVQAWMDFYDLQLGLSRPLAV